MTCPIIEFASGSPFSNLGPIDRPRILESIAVSTASRQISAIGAIGSVSTIPTDYGISPPIYVSSIRASFAEPWAGPGNLSISLLDVTTNQSIGPLVVSVGQQSPNNSFTRITVNPGDVMVFVLSVSSGFSVIPYVELLCS